MYCMTWSKYYDHKEWRGRMVEDVFCVLYDLPVMYCVTCQGCTVWPACQGCTVWPARYVLYDLPEMYCMTCQGCTVLPARDVLYDLPGMYCMTCQGCTVWPASRPPAVCGGCGRRSCPAPAALLGSAGSDPVYRNIFDILYNKSYFLANKKIFYCSQLYSKSWQYCTMNRINHVLSSLQGTNILVNHPAALSNKKSPKCR